MVTLKPAPGTTPIAVPPQLGTPTLGGKTHGLELDPQPCFHYQSVEEPHQAFLKVLSPAEARTANLWVTNSWIPGLFDDPCTPPVRPPDLQAGQINVADLAAFVGVDDWLSLPPHRAFEVFWLQVRYWGRFRPPSVPVSHTTQQYTNGFLDIVFFGTQDDPSTYLVVGLAIANLPPRPQDRTRVPNLG